MKQVNPFMFSPSEYEKKINTHQKERAKPRDLEYDEQCKVIKWRDEVVKFYPPLELLTASANGESRAHSINSKGQSYSLSGIRLKNMGVKSGVPDLHLPVSRTVNGILYHGLFIEMKAVYCDYSTITGKPSKPVYTKISEEQLKYHDLLRKYGNYVAVCYSALSINKIHGDYKIQCVGAIETIEKYLGII